MLYNMKFIKGNIYKLVISAVLLFSASVSTLYAEVPPAGIKNPIAPIDSIDGLLVTILNGLITLGVPVVALAIVYSGFLFVSARGNPEKLTKAKEALLYTVIGAAVLLGALAIAKMVKTTVTGL